MDSALLILCAPHLTAFHGHGPLQINALFVTCFSQSVWDLGSILVQDKSSVRQGSGSSLVLSPCSLSGDIYTSYTCAPFLLKSVLNQLVTNLFFFLTGTPQERPPCQGGDVIIILCSVWCCHAVLQRCLINHRHHLQVWSWTFPDHRGKEKLHGECINAVFTQHFSYDPSAQNQTGAQRYQSELGLAQVSRGIGGFST